MPSTTSTQPIGRALNGLSTGGTIDVDVIKRAVRTRIRAERRLRSPQQRAADAQSLVTVVRELPEIATARCVTLYASMPGEPETEPLRRALRSTGTRVLLPIVLDDGGLDWAEDDGDLHETKGFGGPEPAGPRLGLDAIRQAQVVLVPALAVDTLGNRLGQGAGYYDRALELLPHAVPVFAVVHDSEVLDAAIEPVPVEPHDVPVDAVVTPHRCLRLTHHRH